MDGIELVIFDCDGVLIDSEVISAAMLIRELADHGVRIDADYVVRHFLGRSYPTVLATIRRDFDITLPTDFEAQYRARLLAAFETDLKVVPGIERVLRGMRLPWCVATSSSQSRAERSLQIAGLDALVDKRLFTAGMVANGKPAPDLFLLAARIMGTAPDRCLVIEDSLNGVRAARAAGMRVWRFTGGAHLRGRDLTAPDDARADRHFASFHDFPLEFAA